eukprot:CAMPEP_0171489848 /NCGR_PEP_ID=MMETSP0958-20121227/2989_1 /TAXON_ID=87120 /ORGANISM="Aurantiochytrium limacinum, Strain ATCCMYA-1381" /LENGTH=64 /DNA_ID=CAMNT_0012023115 /DNA_START=783 /DNA_END=977 /DNA_ORIENTATION=+
MSPIDIVFSGFALSFFEDEDLQQLQTMLDLQPNASAPTPKRAPAPSPRTFFSNLLQGLQGKAAE